MRRRKDAPFAFPSSIARALIFLAERSLGMRGLREAERKGNLGQLPTDGEFCSYYAVEFRSFESFGGQQNMVRIIIRNTGGSIYPG